MQIGSPRSLEELVQHRAMLPIVRQGMTKMKTAIDKALAEADAAHTALKQPPDLKAVYDKAYEHMVTKPANVFREMIPIMESGLPVIEKLAAFLDEHRTAIEYRGGMPVTPRRQPAAATRRAHAGRREGCGSLGRRQTQIARDGGRQIGFRSAWPPAERGSGRRVRPKRVPRERLPWKSMTCRAVIAFRLEKMPRH